MTRPTQYLIRMLVFLVAVAGIAAWLAPTLRNIFLANPDLNGLILFLLLVGIVWNLRQVLRLSTRGRLGRDVPEPRASGCAAMPAPRLLAPMACMLAARDNARGRARRASPCPRWRPAACSTASPRASTRAGNWRAT